jgi:hypothetical protein
MAEKNLCIVLELTNKLGTFTNIGSASDEDRIEKGTCTYYTSLYEKVDVWERLVCNF